MEVDPASKAVALSLVMAGGVIAAFAGPETALWTKKMLDYEYEGTYLFLVIYSALPCAMLLVVRFPPVPINEEAKEAGAGDAEEERTLSEM